MNILKKPKNNVEESKNLPRIYFLEGTNHYENFKKICLEAGVPERVLRPREGGPRLADGSLRCGIQADTYYTLIYRWLSDKYLWKILHNDLDEKNGSDHKCMDFDTVYTVLAKNMSLEEKITFFKKIILPKNSSYHPGLCTNILISLLKSDQIGNERKIDLYNLMQNQPRLRNWLKDYVTPVFKEYVVLKQVS